MCADSNFEFVTPLKATLNVDRRAYEFCIYITHSVSFSTPEQCEVAKYTIPAELLPNGVSRVTLCAWKLKNKKCEIRVPSAQNTVVYLFWNVYNLTTFYNANCFIRCNG